MSSPENPQVTSVEFKKFKLPEINLDTSEYEILQAVDEYLSELASLVPPVRRTLDIITLRLDLEDNPDKKRKIVQDFKEQIYNKRLGMACCRMLIEGLIDQNPLIRYDILWKIIQKFSNKYGVTHKDIDEMKKSLVLFENSRAYTNTMRKMYPKDTDLFEAISGIKVDNISEVRIFTTPYGFLIHLPRRLAEKITFLKEYDYANGVSIKHEEVMRIAFVFTDGMSESEIKRVSKHEIIHSKTDFFHPINFSYDYGTKLTELMKVQTPSQEEWENFLVSTYQDSNISFLVELISSADYLEARTQDYFIENYSIFSNGEFRKYTMKVIDSKLLKNQSEADLFSARLHHWKKKSDETLKMAYKAFLRLSKKMVLSRDESVAVLSYLPLELWEKAVNRLDAEEVRKYYLALKKIVERH